VGIVLPGAKVEEDSREQRSTADFMVIDPIYGARKMVYSSHASESSSAMRTNAGATCSRLEIEILRPGILAPG
jgi:hypothetical protein